MNTEVLKVIAGAPLMPCVLPLSVDVACSYVNVLKEEGYPAMEILARPRHEGLELFRKLNDRPERKQLFVGLGTIKTGEDAREAVALQPDFLVSPAFSRRVLAVAVEAGIPYVPGVCMLQDVQNVLDAFEEVGWTVEVLKLCPVEVVTTYYVTMMAAIYPGIVFCPTGTITEENLPEWRSVPCIGPPMELFVPGEWIERGDWAAVRERLSAFAG